MLVDFEQWNLQIFIFLARVNFFLFKINQNIYLLRSGPVFFFYKVLILDFLSSKFGAWIFFQSPKCRHEKNQMVAPLLKCEKKITKRGKTHVTFSWCKTYLPGFLMKSFNTKQSPLLNRGNLASSYNTNLTQSVLSARIPFIIFD